MLQDTSILALLPKISGSISILCSLYILNEIRIDQRSGRLPITAITRAVVGMSVFVLVIGIAWGASNWMVLPSEDQEVDYPLAPTGSRWTCRMQGFLLQLAIGPPLYNAAILYFAQRSIFHNETIGRSTEIATHSCIIIWCLCSATLLLLQDKYHGVGPICWASDSMDCEDDGTCNVKVYSLILYCIPLWAALAYTIVSCIRIRSHVQRNLSDRKNVTKHADSLVALYSVAIFITYAPCIVWSFSFWNGNSPHWLFYPFGLLEPLQGIWNLAIFLMNRRQATRARLRKFFSRLWFCSSCRSNDTDGNDRCDGDDDDETTSSTDQQNHPGAHDRSPQLSSFNFGSSSHYPAISVESQA